MGATNCARGGDKRPRALGSIIAWLEPFIKSLNRPMMFSSKIKRRDRPAAKAASLLFCWLGGSDRPNACHRVSNSYQILSSPKSEQPVSTNRFCSSITCFIDACFQFYEHRRLELFQYVSLHFDCNKEHFICITNSIVPVKERKLQTKTYVRTFCFDLCFHRIERFIYLSRIGDDLLSHSLSCSTIGATMLNFRVRDGIGCFIGAMITKPRQNNIDCYFNQTLCSKLSILCGNCVWLLDLSRQVCLLLDQIKPIGPLVPVS